jgi:hypothetical protein
MKEVLSVERHTPDDPLGVIFRFRSDRLSDGRLVFDESSFHFLGYAQYLAVHKTVSEGERG